MYTLKRPEGLEDLSPTFLEDLLDNHTPNGDSSYKLFVDALIGFKEEANFYISHKDDLKIDRTFPHIHHPYNPFLLNAGKETVKPSLRQLNVELLNAYVKQVTKANQAKAHQHLLNLLNTDLSVSGCFLDAHVGHIVKTTALSEVPYGKLRLSTNVLLSRRLEKEAIKQCLNVECSDLFFYGQDPNDLPEVTL